jgi:hypothetical protein
MLYCSKVPLVYLCSTEWASSEELLTDYKLQTPRLDGKWGSVQGTTDPSVATFAVVFDSDPGNESDGFPPGKKIYMSREARDSKSIRRYPSSEYLHFSFFNGSGYLPVKWSYASSAMAGTGYAGLELSYSDLASMEKPEKTRLLACTLSGKRQTAGHRKRLRFTRMFMKLSRELHVYGSAPFANRTLLDNSKVRSLLPYAFQLTFDNQSHLGDFVGTQFTDSLLLWSKPLFWGSKDVYKYYPRESFIWFDVGRPKYEIPRLLDLTTSENYEAAVPFIAEARDSILNKYNFWPTLERILQVEGSK